MIKFKKIDHDRDPIMIPNTRSGTDQAFIFAKTYGHQNLLNGKWDESRNTPALNVNFQK